MQASQNAPALLHDIPRSGERLSGLSRQNVYQYLREGLLVGVKVNDRTLVTDESLRALPDKLPRYSPDDARRGRKRGAKVAAPKRGPVKRGRGRPRKVTTAATA